MMRHATLGVLAVMLTACTTLTGEIPAPVSGQGRNTFHAGAARMDITPHPGFPMGGHAILGKTGRGYWTRLYSRAIYLEDTDGRALVLVSCELWSIPAGLGDRVAEILAGFPETRHLGRGSLLLAATHTHQSPGNFSTCKAYNNHASPRPRFDARLFEFLAHRIARSILEARRTSVPATIHLEQETLGGVMRNRSLAAFLRNPESRTLMARNGALPVQEPPPGYPDKRVYLAVDARLRVLRIERDDATGGTIGVAAFLATHPTVFGPDLEVYGGDIFGVAAIHAEAELGKKAGGVPPVVALFNGAEGDISPNWFQRNRREVVDLGKKIGAAIAAPAPRTRPVAGAIQVSYGVRKLAGRQFKEEGQSGQPARKRRTDTLAIPGVATFGGAEDGRTLFHDLGWVEHVTGVRTERQGAKHPVLDPRFTPTKLPITRLIARFEGFPDRVSLGVYRLGPLVLATLPGEFTVTMGHRMARALARATGVKDKLVILVGLAQSYLSYFTTPEEYEAQAYEGASTLYGPASADLACRELCALAAAPRPPKRRCKPTLDQLPLTQMIDFPTIHEADVPCFGTLERALAFLAEEKYAGKVYPGALPKIK